MRVAVLISGRGSNLRALIGAAGPYEIGLVVSNVADAPGLGLARAAGLRTATVPHGDFADRETFEAELTRRLEAARTELVVLAGFMRLLTAGFVERWRNRLINVHPSLLPAFRGRDTHARALDAGVRWHGCTVHYVRPEMDAGPILVQAAVPVHPGDTPEILAERVLAREHAVLPLAVRWIAEGAIRVEGERVVPLDPAVNPSQ